MDIASIIISIFGTIASLIGAYISIQAKKSSQKFSLIALKAKDEIVSKKRTSELNKILFEAKNTQNTFLKYKTAPNNHTLDGVDFSKDIHELGEFISLFNENASIIAIESHGKLIPESLYEEISELIESFNSSTSVRVKREAGKKIVLILDRIISRLKNSINLKEEK